MENIFKPCPYCKQTITKTPILEQHQGKLAYCCPYCVSHWSEWVDTEEEAVLSWNRYLRQEDDKIENIFKPCPYCMEKMLKEPTLERHQGRLSYRCPHCLSHRSEWVDNEEEAVLSWNRYMRYEDDIYIFSKVIKENI